MTDKKKGICTLKVPNSSSPINQNGNTQFHTTNDKTENFLYWWCQQKLQRIFGLKQTRKQMEA